MIVIAVGWILTIVAILTIANTVFLWVMDKRIKNVTRYFLKKISEVQVDTKLTGILSGNDEDHEDVHTLSHNLFTKLKALYGLHAKGYSEIVDEVKAIKDIEPTLKDALINFFEEMIVIEYKDEEMSHAQREGLKTKLRMIFKKLPVQDPQQ